MIQPEPTPMNLACKVGVVSLVVASLVACAGTGSGSGIAEPEAFGSTTTHSRSFPNLPAYTCEAARRALLSQGFVMSAGDAEHVNGRKNFQPEPQTHVEIEFHTVCAPDGKGGKKTIAFVNALQDRYALKKSSNSASVGVGPIGSLSLPFSSSDDAMVKVASETITSAKFYDRFFTLLQRYLAADFELGTDPKDEAPMFIPPPAAAASAPVVIAPGSVPPVITAPPVGAPSITAPPSAAAASAAAPSTPAPSTPAPSAPAPSVPAPSAPASAPAGPASASAPAAPAPASGAASSAP